MNAPRETDVADDARRAKVAAFEAEYGIYFRIWDSLERKAQIVTATAGAFTLGAVALAREPYNQLQSPSQENAARSTFIAAVSGGLRSSLVHQLRS